MAPLGLPGLQAARGPLVATAMMSVAVLAPAALPAVHGLRVPARHVETTNQPTVARRVLAVLLVHGRRWAGGPPGLEVLGATRVKTPVSSVLPAVLVPRAGPVVRIAVARVRRAALVVPMAVARVRRAALVVPMAVGLVPRAAAVALRVAVDPKVVPVVPTAVAGAAWTEARRVGSRSRSPRLSGVPR